MANPSDTLTLHALGEETGAGEGGAVNLRSDEVERTAAYVRLRITEDTVPFPLAIETSTDGSTGWRKIDQLMGGSSARAEVLAVDDLDQYLRVTWPAATAGTFSCTAVAHQLLARRDDLYAKISRDICRETDEKEPGTVARALIEATDVVVGPLGAFRDIDCMIRLFGIAAGPLGEVELTLPYEQVPKSVVGAVASIAALICSATASWAAAWTSSWLPRTPMPASGCSPLAAPAHRARRLRLQPRNGAGPSPRRGGDPMAGADGGYPAQSAGAAASRLLARAEALQPSAMLKFHEGIAKQMQAATDKSFQAQTSPRGERWPELAQVTINKRRGVESYRKGHRGGGFLRGKARGSAVLALLKTRKLQRETKYVAKPETILLETPAHGDPHVTGAELANGGILPKRNYTVFERAGGKLTLIPEFAKLYRDGFIAHVSAAAEGRTA
jgi:hypothetical protein